MEILHFNACLLFVNIYLWNYWMNLVYYLFFYSITILFLECIILNLFYFVS